MMPFRFVAALFREVFVSFSGGSLFLDSPLNDDGEAQVWACVPLLVCIVTLCAPIFYPFFSAPVLRLLYLVKDAMQHLKFNALV